MAHTVDPMPAEHEAELRHGGVGEDLLDVVLRDRDEPARAARSRRPTTATTWLASRQEHEQEVHPADEVDAGGHHRRGVDQRRDRRGAGHRVGQPDVERDLGALAGGAGEQAQRGESQRGARRRRPASGPDVTRRGPSSVGPLLHPRERQRAGQREQRERADQEGEVADPVDDERLAPGVDVREVLVPEADQQVAAEPDALPADEQQRGGCRPSPGASSRQEQVQVGHEAREAGVVAPCTRSEYTWMREPMPGDVQQHHRGERGRSAARSGRGSRPPRSSRSRGQGCGSAAPQGPETRP